jgi:transitional endoplasmic reticulum ATPase
MAKCEKDHGGSELEPWKRRLDELVARKRFLSALRLLDQIINDNQPSLFDGLSWLTAQRRVAWLYRIDLLRGLGRLHEALAWVCLECELQPENVAAKALKERLKRQLRPEAALVDTEGRKTLRPELRDPWRGVAGMRELKAMLERDVVLPLQEPELYRQYRVSLPNGMLLYGPPGCGKTFIARKLAEVLAFHFIEIKPSDLGSIYVHGTQEKIGKLFSEARQHAPCLLFLDEIDAMLPTRSPELYHSYAAEVNEFLAQVNEAAASRLLVVGATNRLDKIDPAALRPGRFDKKVFVGPPDLEARVELLKLAMTDRPQAAMDFLAVARECDGYTCAELTFIVNEAARRALGKRRAISAEDLMAELAANPPAHATTEAEQP